SCFPPWPGMRSPTYRLFRKGRARMAASDCGKELNRTATSESVLVCLARKRSSTNNADCRDNHRLDTHIDAHSRHPLPQSRRDQEERGSKWRVTLRSVTNCAAKSNRHKN